MGCMQEQDDARGVGDLEGVVELEEREAEERLVELEEGQHDAEVHVPRRHLPSLLLLWGGGGQCQFQKERERDETLAWLGQMHRLHTLPKHARTWVKECGVIQVTGWPCTSAWK